MTGLLCVLQGAFLRSVSSNMVVMETWGTL